MSYPPCGRCERPMRAYNQRIADHPGTVRHTGRGRCSGCYQQEAQAAQTPPAHTLTHTATYLEQWLTERRRRGIPADGAPLRITA